MKRIALIATLGFLSVGTTLWVSQSYVTTWEPRLRSQLEERVGNAIGGRVHIERISISFIHRIALHDVEIWDTHVTPEAQVFRAKEVALTLSLIDLPRAIVHHNPLESIGLITFDTPLVSLSPEFLNRQKGGPSPGKTPLWFTVKWDQGTFQWKDPQAPHGAWTLYKSRGQFRILGPHTDATAEGSLEQAESIYVHFSSLVHRWTADATLRKGDIPGVITLVKHFTNRSLFPEGWKAQGLFNLDIKAGGHWPIRRSAGLANLIQEAHLSLEGAQLDTGPNNPPLQVNGGLGFKSQRVEFTGLSVIAANNAFKITGHFWPFTKVPQLELQAKGTQTDLSLLTRYLSTNPTATPWLHGTGEVDLSLNGAVTHPNVIVRASIPKGSIGSWPFENAVISASRTDTKWDIHPSTMRIWDGQVTLNGSASHDQLDLELTGNDLSLASLAVNRFNGTLKGSLNFSLHMRGPTDNSHTVGSYWINQFNWGHTYTESLRGNLDVTPAHFELKGASEDDNIHLRGEGLRTPKLITLQEFQIDLPSGALLTAHGSYQPPLNRIRLAFEAQNLSLSDDLPALPARFSSLKGTAGVEGHLDGPLSGPTLKLSVVSHDVQWGGQAISPVTAALHWTPDEWAVDSFQLGTGYTGSLHAQHGNAPQWDLKLALNKAPVGWIAIFLNKKALLMGTVSGSLALKDASGMSGFGDLTLNDGSLGSMALSQAWLRFKLQGRNLEVQRFSWVAPLGKADFKGFANWGDSNANHQIERIFYRGEGRVSSLNDGTLWNMPCHFKGQLFPKEAWKGDFLFEAPTVKIRSSTGGSLAFHINWDAQSVSWDNVRLGETLSGHGSLHWVGDQSQWTSEINAHETNLSLWQACFWPNLKNPIQGSLSGAFTLSGSPQDPVLQFSGKIHQGHWKAFAFDNNFSGTWEKSGLDPLEIVGTLPHGGQFHFHGRIASADKSASGSLDLTQIDLKPLGESLAFPDPLEGKANGTFTVNGPLDQLHLAGHVEGTGMSYGKINSSPLKLQSLVMDLKMDPSSESANVTRVTVTQAVAKTLEEEVRLNPGSYVDFAGTSMARLRVGTEIRNLHLGVFTLFGGLDINGTWQIKPEGFAVQGDLYTRSLFINDYQLEQGHIEATYYDRQLSFQPPRQGTALVTGLIDFQNAPQLKFKDFVITGNGHQGLHLTGDVGPGLWNFSMEGQGMDIGTLSGLAGFPYPLQGTADVKIHGTGDLDHPQVDGTVQIQKGQVVGLNFQTGSAAFIWQGQHMTFTHLALSDPGRYTLTGAGLFPLMAKTKSGYQDKTIDFSVRLVDSNLGLLQSFSREVKQAKGSVEALLQIRGTSDTPTIRGSIRVKNGDVVGAHYFRHLENFQLAADFDGNDLVISEFRGRSSKGDFTGGGHIVFAGLEPKFYDLHLEVPSSKAIEVTVPELAIPESPLAKKLHFLTTASQCDVKGHVTFRGPAEAPVFFGQAYLSNGHFTFPPSIKNPPPPGFLEWIRRVSWDVDLHFMDNAWFENELVEANLTGALHLKGPSDRLRVDGGMDIPEGKISYLGIDFDIRQARFDLRSVVGDNGIVNTPYVRGQADSTVQTVDPVTGQSVDDTITLTIDYAPVNEIKPHLVSSLDPTLSQDKLLARATQLEVNNLTPQERNSLYQQQMVRLIDSSLATPLARNLLKRTGLVDELRVSHVINPTATGLPTDPNNPVTTQQNAAVNLLAGTKYTLQKNLSNRLALGYGLRFEQVINPDLTNNLDLRSDVEMSYRFLSNLYLRGSFDLPSTSPGVLPERKVTIEPRWRFGWWGNTNKPKPGPVKLPAADQTSN